MFIQNVSQVKWSISHLSQSCPSKPELGFPKVYQVYVMHREIKLSESVCGIYTTY